MSLHTTILYSVSLLAKEFPQLLSALGLIFPSINSELIWGERIYYFLIGKKILSIFFWEVVLQKDRLRIAGIVWAEKKKSLVLI